MAIKIRPIARVTYVLPAVWSVALIDDCESLLTEGECEALAAWQDLHPDARECIYWTDTAVFSDQHDALAFAPPCDCLEYTFYIPERGE